ncbi:MAG: EI24 domain-containing protein [Verrucomicrobiota bacterium]
MPASKRNYVHGILSGLRAYLRVPGTVRRYRLGHYLLAPAALSFLLSLAILTIVILSAIALSQYVDRTVDIPVRWLDETINWIAGILGAFAMLAVFVFLHKRIVLIVLAPFLARLSELTVRGLEGTQFKIKLDFKAALKRSVYINTRSIFLELSATLSLLAIGFFVPPLALFTTTLVFLIESRFVGFGLIDFPLEYKGFSVDESIAYAKSHRALATGLGAGYFLLLAIPIVGWMIAPTFGTVAGTLHAMEELQQAETS